MARVRKDGSLPIALAEMLEEMMREARGGGEEDELMRVQNMREVSSYEYKQ